MGQSSNDVIPTAIHIASLEAISKNLLPGLIRLESALQQKAEVFDKIVKIRRTHLNDATPIRLGQEFSGYGRQIELAIERIQDAAKGLQELALGGAAVGTSINTHPQFAAQAIKIISAETRLPFREAENHFQA
jgi:fumarate hydratase, class II